ncbi:MAG: translation initiation factor, partial [Opitutales bacterium]
MSKPERISTDGGKDIGQNPFAGLSSEGLSVTKEGEVKGAGQPVEEKKKAEKKSRGRVDIVREKSGRGGK